MFTRPVLLLIRVYQKTLSFDTGVIRFLIPSGRVCRFTPTCSEYAYQAIAKHGILAGTRLAAKRIARCHPWSPGGPDPVPPKL